LLQAKFLESVHAMRAETSCGMHRWIIEKNAVTAGFQLEFDHVTFVIAPIGMIHASRLVIAAVPGRKWITLCILLAPIRRGLMKTRSEGRRPVLIKSFEFHD